ncbi:hypothetical protein [Pseudoalteromonas sp. SR44-2]|uniref:hypothetical protein n=1 Tax=Pseudoalteromonas sp. SR44-2 TaxID=2760937 RepID=UPI0015FEF999|nr:hypothetical protein [Pseudoalteromonas sp. SR44-2]MBB1337943.1 hypothetical protein [Pseudoalteromonas sp. SR44-2]
MSNFFSFLGFGLTPQDKVLAEKLNNKSYSSLRVVGRGTLMVDASEVRKSISEQDLYKKAKEIVEGSQA